MSEISFDRVDDYRWRIPKSFQEGMLVPGMIYTDKVMLENIKIDKSAQQVANVASLPGIVKYSLAMPDIHWGYGFPIGGVAATDPSEGGVISPGGVGFDINCLSGDSSILHDLGYSLPIRDFENRWKDGVIKCFDFRREKSTEASICNFLKRKPQNRVYELVTGTGRKIIATEDHPFYTKDGMKPLDKLTGGEEVAIYPFEGVPYEKPSDEVIVTEEAVRKILKHFRKGSRGNALGQILKHLKKRNLLSIRYDSEVLPCLLKVMAYVLGDGTIYFSGAGGSGITWFYGKPQDLEEIRQDVVKIGYTPSRIYKRERNHKMRTMYSEYGFSTTETSFKVCSSSFAALLIALGTPFGNKASQDFRVPPWLFKAPLWQKRLFLASFFGAEMSTPQCLSEHRHNFYCPVVSVNKKKGYVQNGRVFLEEIALLLEEFGVQMHRISKKLSYVNDKGETSDRLRLILSSSPESMMNLYARVGFEYNKKRRFLGNVVVHYLKRKGILIRERKEIAFRARRLRKTAHLSAKCIYDELDTKAVNFRFIQRSVYGGRKTAPRIGKDKIGFDEFLSDVTSGLGESGMVWDDIVTKREIEFDDYVYDFTVNHPDHNFVANGFVVSNCGVRLIRTNLNLKDTGNHIEKLIDALFANVPCGVGSGAEVVLSNRELKQVVEKGARWVVESGHGVSEDISHTEEGGALGGANHDNVSARAVERGCKQLGTLGSGNHFLEVQVVEKVYDNKTAAVFGLSEGQVTVMIHCGSRGFGHQVCQDYLGSVGAAMKKYGISVPDRQLACVPVNSRQGRAYFSAMACAANYAWANRQLIMDIVRKTFEKEFGSSWRKLGMELVYDVAHNIAKFEKHNGKTLCVHRKGATRAFPAGRPELPRDYFDSGQPVLIPGDMGTNSYVMVGTDKAMNETWGSTCHGAGRVMSRHAAVKAARGKSIIEELRQKNIVVRAKGKRTLAEEAPYAYKDVNKVVEVVHNAGISMRVARLKPMGVVKG